MDACHIQNLFMRVDLHTRGAEMLRFRTVGGLELLWEGDPAFWPRHAPHLFPVVGSTVDDQIMVEGKAYPMPRRGFARDMTWTLVRLTREDCTFVLKDSEATRKHYPYAFELRITYKLDDWALHVDYQLINTGEVPLPASLGAHPGLRWPMMPGHAKEDYLLLFEHTEEAPIRRLDEKGLLRPDVTPTPVKGSQLPLNDDLFRDDVLIFDSLKSRRLRLVGPTRPSLEFGWEGFSHLGLWSRPGANFICIEPWAGVSSPQGYTGDITRKPGIHLVFPGSRHHYRYSIRLHPE